MQSTFPSTKENCSENTKVMKQVVERDEEATTNPKGLNYPNQASVTMEVDLEEYHNPAEADLPITKKLIKMQSNG